MRANLLITDQISSDIVSDVQTSLTTGEKKYTFAPNTVAVMDAFFTGDATITLTRLQEARVMKFLATAVNADGSLSYEDTVSKELDKFLGEC